MRILHNIFIIIFIFSALLLARYDITTVYDRTISYLGEKISLLTDNEDIELISIKNEDQNNELKESIDLNKEIDTPGALKVPDDFFIPNSNNTKLSTGKIIDITNEYRVKNNNLNILKENQKLNFIAEKKLKDMFMNQYFEHDSPDGVGVGDLGNQVAYEYITIGENLALGNFKNDEALVNAWMESPGHRENILNEHYSEIGVAVGKGTFEERSVWMAVQHFALPKSACPSVDEVLRGVINIDEKQVEEMEKDLAIRRDMIDSRVVYEELTTNEQIDKYNSLVVVYNKLIVKLKEKINKYNEQIRAFNFCIAENTGITQ